MVRGDESERQAGTLGPSEFFGFRSERTRKLARRLGKG